MSRISSGVPVRDACGEAGIQDRGSQARWKKLQESTGSFSDPPSKTPGPSRKLPEGSPGLKYLRTQASGDTYVSTKTLACKVLDYTESKGNPVNVSYRTVQWAFRENRFTLKRLFIGLP